MTQNEVTLELSSGLAASGTARAAMVREFGERIGAEQMMDLRIAVSTMITSSIRSQDHGPIRVRAWSRGGRIHGEISDERGGGAEFLRTHVNGNGEGLAVLDAITRDWGTDGDMSWFVV